MVTINKHDGHFVFEVKGMHKLWSFKNQLTIPISHIERVYQNTESIRGWKGWKLLGLSIPSFITSGTFYKEGNKIFWDVSDIEKCIIIHLKDEDYDQLIIEVANPEDAIKVLTSQ